MTSRTVPDAAEANALLIEAVVAGCMRLLSDLDIAEKVKAVERLRVEVAQEERTHVPLVQERN
jgi:hypothetical protein